MCDNTERVTIIEDNDFLNTDTSELVKGDYYLLSLILDWRCCNEYSRVKSV